jgi:hypothetical protein
VKREYVLTRTALVTAVGFAAYLAVSLGYTGMTPAVQAQVVDVLNVTLPVVIPLLSALWARLGVTPIYDPKATVAVPLVPGVASTVDPDLAARLSDDEAAAARVTEG